MKNHTGYCLGEYSIVTCEDCPTEKECIDEFGSDELKDRIFNLTDLASKYIEEKRKKENIQNDTFWVEEPVGKLLSRATGRIQLGGDNGDF